MPPTPGTSCASVPAVRALTYTLLAAGLSGALGSVPRTADAAPKTFGLKLPPTLVPIDDTRYRSRKDWARTLRFFRAHYPARRGIVWKRLEAPPGVEALHIQNTRAGRRWDGINIYQTKRGVIVSLLGHRAAR